MKIGNDYIGLYIDESTGNFILTVLLFQLIIYYKKDISVNIGITIFNIIIELSARAWKHDPMSILLDKISQQK